MVCSLVKKALVGTAGCRDVVLGVRYARTKLRQDGISQGP